MDEARAGVAAVLGTDVRTVALTHSTTEGMNAATLAVLAVVAIDPGMGARAVTTRHEHAGGLGPLYALRERGIENGLADFLDDVRSRLAPLFGYAAQPGGR